MELGELIAKCKENDRWAQKRLTETYAPYLFAICVRYMRDHEEAKDILQETLISIFKNLHQFKEGEGAFKAWIKRICVNNALQKFRKKSYTQEVYFEEMPDERVSMPDVYAKLGKDELMKVIMSIPELYRNVFCMYVIEDYSHAEIAEALKMKESSSRSALTRAKKLIREKLWELQKVVA